jgi:molybdate transport system substrate-binding protein
MTLTPRSPQTNRSRAAAILRAFLLGLLVFSTACNKTEAPAPAPGEAKAETLVVFAAASLRESFTAMGEDFKRTHAGLQITFNFAGTQELRTQVEQGAALDVFASADQRHMQELVRAGHLAEPVTFARNEPVIVVSREASNNIHALADLANAQRIVIGTPEVPIGRYTLQILDRAAPTLGADFRSKVDAHVASRELNVRQVLTKVKLGEAQAGIVYRTDAMTTPDLSVVSIAADINVIAEYPIAVAVKAPHPSVGREWVAYVRSAAGQATLARAGFLPPVSSP